MNQLALFLTAGEVTRAPGVLEATLTTAGFSDVTVEAVPAPLRLPSAAECVRFERESFGALHQMLAGVAPDEHPAVWDEIEAAVARFETPEGFVGPCDLLVGSAPSDTRQPLSHLAALLQPGCNPAGAG